MERRGKGWEGDVGGGRIRKGREEGRGGVGEGGGRGLVELVVPIQIINYQ